MMAKGISLFRVLFDTMSPVSASGLSLSLYTHSFIHSHRVTSTSSAYFDTRLQRLDSGKHLCSLCPEGENMVGQYLGFGYLRVSDMVRTPVVSEMVLPASHPAHATLFTTIYFALYHFRSIDPCHTNTIQPHTKKSCVTTLSSRSSWDVR